MPSSSAAPRPTAPAPVPFPAEVPERPAERRFSPITALFLLVWLGGAGTLLWYGLAYYLTPLAERPFAALHDQLKPSGTLGLAYGIAGATAMLVGVLSYSLRRRVRVLARLGKLKQFLTVHIFLCTMGPFLIVLHTSFKLGGIVAIAFWSMVAVAVSGAFGRYVYVRIPRTLNGQMLTLQTLEQQRARLLKVISDRSGLAAADVDRLLATARRPMPRGAIGALRLALWEDLTGFLRDRRLQQALTARGVPPIARATTVALIREEATLERRMALLAPFQRMFRYWHLFHLPLAIVMLVIVMLHVTVAILFGYAWAY
jgi:hypothetical protein